MKFHITLEELKEAERSIKKSAAQQGLPVSVVRESIRKAIAEGMANPDPEVRAEWAKTPFKDRAPSPEEFVAWFTREAFIPKGQ